VYKNAISAELQIVTWPTYLYFSYAAPCQAPSHSYGLIGYLTSIREDAAWQSNCREMLDAFVSYQMQHERIRCR
jgi:hypothetical protein